MALIIGLVVGFSCSTWRSTAIWACVAAVIVGLWRYFGAMRMAPRLDLPDPVFAISLAGAAGAVLIGVAVGAGVKRLVRWQS